LILLTAVLAGILSGWGYAKWTGGTWQPPVFRALWLVFVGFLPQMMSFYLPSTRRLLPNEFASVSLVISQLALLGFAILNVHLPGMPVLLAGLALNLTVILVNGGWMPLPLNVAAKLADSSTLSKLQIGERISSASKDILLPESEIILPWLADRFVPPSFVPYRFAFSLGDICIAVGAYWMLVRKQPAQVPASGVN